MKRLIEIPVLFFLILCLTTQVFSQSAIAPPSEGSIAAQAPAREEGNAAAAIAPPTREVEAAPAAGMPPRTAASQRLAALASGPLRSEMRVTEMAASLGNPLPPQRGGGGGGFGGNPGGQQQGGSAGKLSKTAWIAIIGTLAVAATAITVLVVTAKELPGEANARIAEQIAIQNQNSTNSFTSTNSVKASGLKFGF